MKIFPDISQQQTQSTTQATKDVQQKVETITSHANNTSQSAAETRDISNGLEKLSDHLESLINQFTLSQSKPSQSKPNSKTNIKS